MDLLNGFGIFDFKGIARGLLPLIVTVPEIQEGYYQVSNNSQQDSYFQTAQQNK